LNFELVQIGTQTMKNVKIYNPSDEPIEVQLYLTTDNFLKMEMQNQEQQEKNNIYERDFYKMMTQGAHRSKEKKEEDDNEEFGDRGYISMYCA